MALDPTFIPIQLAPLGNSVLFQAIASDGTGGLTVIRALLEAGADPDVADDIGLTPMLWDIEHLENPWE